MFFHDDGFRKFVQCCACHFKALYLHKEMPMLYDISRMVQYIVFR